MSSKNDYLKLPEIRALSIPPSDIYYNARTQLSLTSGKKGNQWVVKIIALEMLYTVYKYNL